MYAHADASSHRASPRVESRLVDLIAVESREALFAQHDSWPMDTSYTKAGAKRVDPSLRLWAVDKFCQRYANRTLPVPDVVRSEPSRIGLSHVTTYRLGLLLASVQSSSDR
jgi:hypothetical protein